MKETRLRFSVLTATTAATLLVGCNSIKQQRVTERQDQTQPSMAQSQGGFDTFGRKWAGETNQPQPVVAKESAQELNTGVVSLTKRVPDTVNVGTEYPSTLTITAQEPAANVVVTDVIPEGTEYVRSEPAGARDANLLSWKFPSMQKGQVQQITNYFKSSKEGILDSCATITATRQICASTLVGKPVLTLTKTGPEAALVGSDVNYVNLVGNKGNLAAHDVIVTDTLPEGLQHSSGQNALTFKVGDLAPNETRTVPVTLKAVKRGLATNKSSVTAANAATALAEARTTIHEPGLAVFKTGDSEQYLNRRAGYTIVVTNTGDTTLQKVIVTDTAPQQTTFVSAEGATMQGQTATWQLAELPPGQAQTFKTVMTSKTSGSYHNEVAASAMGLREVAAVNTTWKGVGGLTVEAVDDKDPIQVGETTTYIIRVTNQGTADLTNIGLKASLSDQIKPIAAVGLSIGGQTMTVSTIPKLAPNESATYEITAEGLVAGDARLKVTVTADGLSSPVTEEESTQVY